MTDSPDSNLIELNDVVKIYKTPAGDFMALKGIDLRVGAGEFVAVIGKSGSGKSTLINTITGIDRPTLGEVVVAGVPVHRLSEDDIARWRGRNLGVIFQFFQLLPTLTLVENVMLPMEFCRLYSPSERKARAMQLLERVQMADQAHKLPSAVSGGQQQRVAIARALANDPPLLVADEPTGSLDSKTADAIFQLFEELVGQGKTILMVTHDRDLAARVNRVVLIADGEIVDQYVSRALDTLDQQQLVQISSRLEPVSVPPNTVIFRKGDPADRFFIIIKGEVEVIVEHTSGREIVGARLESGQYFGEMGLLSGGVRTATVRTSAAGGAVLMALDRETFTNLAAGSQLTHDSIAQLMRRRTTANHLISTFPDLDEEQWDEIQDDFEVLHFEPGQIIVRRGDPARKFFVISKGQVEVLQLDGKTVVTRLEEGRFFGEIGLLRGGVRTATVRAAPDVESGVELLAVDQNAFNQLMADSQMTKEEIAAIGMRRRLSSKLAEFGFDDLQRKPGPASLFSAFEEPDD